MKLDGKVALITGGTRGIGAATAQVLAERGADVALVGRNDDGEARQVMARIEKLGRRGALILADMSRPEDAARAVEETAQQLGSPDVLVHSAGGPVPGSFLEISPEAWHAAFDVHVHAVFYLCRAAIPAMRQKKEGVIVLISSVAGIRGVAFAPAYQVVKGALPQFARAGPRVRRRQHPRERGGARPDSHPFPCQHDAGGEAAQPRSSHPAASRRNAGASRTIDCRPGGE